MEPLTEQELAELNENFLAELDRNIEADESFIEIKEEFLSAPDPWYGVPLWLLKWLLKHLPKK